VARSRSVVASVSLAEAEYREIEQWYRDTLAKTAPPEGLAWTPITIGPTWQHDGNAWVLPNYTLGWRVLAWCGKWLVDKHGQPWQFTPEQARFILWYFAIDPETGEFTFHSAVFQRLKGHGKDPIAACLAAAACFAEVTFDHWDGDRPVGREETNAWVQCVAVSQEQTKNTMRLFPSLIPPETRRHYGVQIGKLTVYGLGDTRQIEAVTSSPLAIEGGRPTLVIRNETQNWNQSNGGHDMAGAIEGNVAKSQNAAARILDICNAYRPGEDSVAERAREAWEATQGEDAEAHDFGLMYDSLEAPPEAPLTAEAAASVVESIRGDSTWLSTRRITNSILNGTNSQSESRRKWYNQITATEDARFDPLKIKLCATTDRLSPGDEIVIFGDGSKSDDATGLVACRVSDGLTQVLHVQQPRRKELVSRAATTLAVQEAFRTYKVIAFWFDPSHTIDDDATEGDERFWHPTVDEWALSYGRKLKHWAVLSGPMRHAILWDMVLPSHVQAFTMGVEQLDEDIESGAFRFHESGTLVRHLGNARRFPTRFGVSMQKNARESAKKIDLAVCAAGARMLWRQHCLAKIAEKSKGAPGSGRVIVMS
jgi:phage terminase large subunit-like protein